ncbi:general odorant-binding protein 67 [Anabrus simplex]|uniref:general odorant-binding protein 67 n=1 Tax=Anabrus simplex TaxID=316456 RepID=UPI0034DD8A39
MLKIAVLLSVATTCVVCDYSLFPSDADDVYSEMQLFSHHRFRRGSGNGDEPDLLGFHKGPHSEEKRVRCCNVPRVEPEKVKAALDKCKEQFPKPEHPMKRGCWMKPDGCFKECLFKELELLGDDGMIDGDKIIAFIESSMKTDEANAETQKTLMESIVPECLKNATQSRESSKCKSGAQEFLWCAKKQLILSCPVELWQDNEHCNGLREMIKEGGPKNFKYPPCNATETA